MTKWNGPGAKEYFRASVYDNMYIVNHVMP